MGKITILSKSSNNSYSYADSDDINLTANGNFELDEQQKRVLSANGNIFYNGMSIANFSTSMYNGILQYQLYGTTADNTEKAFKALSGVQEQLKAQVEGTTATPTPSGNGTSAVVTGSEGVADSGATAEAASKDVDSESESKSSSSEAATVGDSDQGEPKPADGTATTGDGESAATDKSTKNK
jgi:hypothetical protein